MMADTINYLTIIGKRAVIVAIVISLGMCAGCGLIAGAF